MQVIINNQLAETLAKRSLTCLVSGKYVKLIILQKASIIIVGAFDINFDEK